ncbi:MAG: homoserine O-acetyltransferase [Pseudohongiellaceae bacterium]
MPTQFPADSVGLVVPQTIHFDDELVLRCGKTLKGFDLVIETYGKLNSAGSNGVLICHALSGDHHAAGFHDESDSKPGWWDACIGPGKAIDTNHFYVVAVNNLGGCAGSTGPASIDPNTNKYFGPDFPIVTVRDWVESQVLLSDKLGIQKWAAIVGGSLGGMQVLRWAISYPERLGHAVCIATAPKLSAQNIAFNEVARQSITNDVNFHDGRYLDKGTYPKQGLMLARMVGHITYLSDLAMGSKFGTNNSSHDPEGEKFGRDLRSGSLSFGFDIDFQVESYLHYQGERFSENFDANTYLLMTKALDYFDPAVDYDGDLSRALERCSCSFLVLSFSTDWRFPPARSREIVDHLIKAEKDVTYLEVDAEQGHDSFLLPIPRYINGFKAYMTRVYQEQCNHAS